MAEDVQEPSYDPIDALKLVPLFYTINWTPEKKAEWLRITGSTEATTKVLCDHVRAAIEVYPKLLSDAFDLGFKAAGGTMIPDEARNVVELALTRGTISELADLIDYAVEFEGYGISADLKTFLETVSIYRSKK